VKKFLFDTNIFNAILDNKIFLISSKNCELYITHIQKDELEACSNEQRRKDLLKVFKIINPHEIPTESAIWDVSRWGSSKWGIEENVYKGILNQLEKRKPRNRGNTKDALIGETAFRTGIILVSNDKALRDTIIQIGGMTMCLDDFLM
jgi:hypothetical protein